ncbi:hypothetical protein D9M71_573690 [compost metagenome]
MEGPHLADFVGFDHGEGRAFHCTSMAQATDQATRQGGFARPQVPFEEYHAATAGHLGQCCTEFDGGLFIGQKQI